MEVAEDAAEVTSEWELHHDEISGQVFYSNRVTGESSWEAPAELSVLPTPTVSFAQQWTEVSDDTGRVYYVNLTTMETSWEPPHSFRNATAAPRRPSTAEQMDHLNALLSGGDGDDEDEGEEEDRIEDSPASVESVSSHLISSDASTTDGSEWMMFLNEVDGVPYYYNHLTDECVWEPPAAFLAYHLAQQSHDELVASAIDTGINREINDDTGGMQPESIPAGVTAPPPQTPSTSIQITPEFEEKVRRAIESMSKTPVGSSRLLLVRTPTVKSLNSSRPVSRPTSSSGASARQRLVTARVASEADESPPPDDSKPNDDKEEFHDPQDADVDTTPIALVVVPEPVDLSPSDEELELLQQVAMMRDLVVDEMALTIQCMVRCVQARRRVARKRQERQLLGTATEIVCAESAEASAPDERGAQGVEGSSEELLPLVGSESITAQQPGVLSEQMPPDELLNKEIMSTAANLQSSEERREDVVSRAREGAPSAAEGNGQSTRAGFRDDQEQPASEKGLEDTRAEEGENVGTIDSIRVPDIDLSSDIIESIIAEENTVSEKKDDDPCISAAQDASVPSSARTVNNVERTDAQHQQVSSDQQEAVLCVPAESPENPAVSLNDEQTVLIPHELQVDRPDHHEANITKSSSLLVPLAIGCGDLTTSKSTDIKASGQEIHVESTAARTTSRQARSGRRVTERPSSATTPSAGAVRPAVDTSSGRLAILNITTFFPPNPHRDRIKVMPSNPVASAAVPGRDGIQRKPLPTQEKDRHQSSTAAISVGQRDHERAVRTEAMRKVHEETKAKWIQEVNEWRHLFAAATVRRTRSIWDLEAAEEARRQRAMDERNKWLKDQTSREPADESSLSLWEMKRGEATVSDTIARVQSAMQPKGFVELMMHERLSTIHRAIERLQISNHSRMELRGYWQQLAQRFPSSLEEGIEIEDPYWARLHANLRATATTSRQDLAQQLARHRTDSFDSLLHKAAWRGHVELVRFLVLELDDDVHAIDCSATQITPLHEACRGGHVPVVDFLLSRGAFLDAVDAHGDTPLHVACRLGWTQVVHALITAGQAQDERDAWKKPIAADGANSSEHVRVLQVLSWSDCFHLRNGKRRSAMDIATRSSLVEFLYQYSKDLPVHHHDTSPSTGRSTEAAMKKKRAKPQRPQSAAKLHPGVAK